ncbi:50S ribosomal protein L16 [Nanoarchaeota archaeon]|nr:MAG: 50S ribosomal protein L16 [Nanoarchaeota archaeon]
MARLRPARVYRRVRRPYVRVSRFREKSYVSGVPPCRIRVFEMGNKKGEFERKIVLISKNSLQIRENALEAARITANKFLEKKVGPENYYMKIKVYPHHVMREHALATGAGADRFQRGMTKAFGKPIGRAAQVDEGQEIIVVKTNDKFVELAKEAVKRASTKLPGSYRIVVN